VNFREPLGCAHQVPGPDYIMKHGNFFHCWDRLVVGGKGMAPHFEMITYTKYWRYTLRGGMHNQSAAGLLLLYDRGDTCEV